MYACTACAHVLDTLYQFYRKHSVPHEGVVYLIRPEDLTGSWSELDLLEGQGKGDYYSNQEDDVKKGSFQGHRKTTKIEDSLDEDEREMSFSVPSSPKLLRKDTLDLLQSPRLRSHSFDDLLSNINNEEVFAAPGAAPIPLALSPSEKAPLIQLESSSDSGSESDYEGSTTTPAEESRSHERGLGDSTELSRQHPVAQGGAFTRFKGRFLKKVKFGAPRTKHQQDIGTESGSTTSALETEESDVQTKRQGTRVLMSVGQKFKNSPSLLRKVGVNRRARFPQGVLPTSEDETHSSRQEAREKSQSAFVNIV